MFRDNFHWERTQKYNLDQCFMPEAIDDSVTANNRKRKRDKHTVDVLPSTKNLTPVTIMVVDTIGTVKSRRLLKVLLDSGSTITLIKKNAYQKHVNHVQSLRVGW